MNECPYCGEDCSKCGTTAFGGDTDRQAECYNRQLAQQTTLLQEALEEIKAYKVEIAALRKLVRENDDNISLIDLLMRESTSSPFSEPANPPCPLRPPW